MHARLCVHVHNQNIPDKQPTGDQTYRKWPPATYLLVHTLAFCRPGIMSAQLRGTLILEFDLPLAQSQPKNFKYMKNVC